MNTLVWLREETSKWLMRTQNAGRLLNIPLRATTASSVLTLALQKTFLAQYTLIVLMGFSIGIIFFIWAYDRFHVMNIQNRWNADRADNYVGPTTAMNQLVAAEREAVLAQSIKNDWGMEKTRKEMRKAAEKAVAEYRNGINMERFDRNG